MEELKVKKWELIANDIEEIGNTELAVKEWALHNRLSPWNLKQIKIYHLARIR